MTGNGEKTFKEKKKIQIRDLVEKKGEFPGKTEDPEML